MGVIALKWTTFMIGKQHNFTQLNVYLFEPLKDYFTSGDNLHMSVYGINYYNKNRFDKSLIKLV